MLGSGTNVVVSGCGGRCVVALSLVLLFGALFVVDVTWGGKIG